MGNKKSKESVFTKEMLLTSATIGLLQFVIAAFCAIFFLRVIAHSELFSFLVFSKETLFWIGLMMLTFVGISMYQIHERHERKQRYLKVVFLVELIILVIAFYGGEIYPIGDYGRAFLLAPVGIAAIGLFLRGIVYLFGYAYFLSKKKKEDPEE